MSNRQQLNMQAIQRTKAAQEKAEKQKKSWKGREGGINSEIYDNLGERDKGRVEALGGHIPHWAGKSKGAIGFAAGLHPGILGLDKDSPSQQGTPNNLIESAAWEMGYGNVKDEKTFQKVLTEIENQGFTKFDSQQDVHKFRENWTKGMIEKHAPKYEAPQKDEAVKKEDKQNELPVEKPPTQSQEVSRAFTYTGQPNTWMDKGGDTGSIFNPAASGGGQVKAAVEPPQSNYDMWGGGFATNKGGPADAPMFDPARQSKANVFTQKYKLNLSLNNAPDGASNVNAIKASIPGVLGNTAHV